MLSDLDRYLIKHTTKPSQLTSYVIQETHLETALPNMLSGPVEGRFLAMLVSMTQAKKVLELGTFTGFSALMMAENLPVDGSIVTYEVREEHAKIAQKYFNKSPHGHKIKLKLENALSAVPHEPDLFDLIFIDADKRNYPHYYELAVNKLRKGGLVIIDNALWKNQVLNPTTAAAKSIALTNTLISQDDRVENVLLPVRDGIMLAVKL